MADVFEALADADEAARKLLEERNDYRRRLDLALKDRDRAEVELIKLRELKLDDSERRELEKLRAFRRAIDKAYQPKNGEFAVTVGRGSAGPARVVYQ